MMNPQKNTEKQRKKRAEVKLLKKRVTELEHLGFVVNAVYLQEEISSGRRTRKDVLLSLLKLKQEILDTLEKEKVSELPDKLGQIVKAAEKCNVKGGPCTKLDVSKAIGVLEKNKFSQFKIDPNDVKVLKLYEKLKKSYQFCLDAEKRVDEANKWIEKVIENKVIEDTDKHDFKGAFIIKTSKYFARPQKFTNDELELLKKGNLENELEISVSLAETGEQIGVVKLNTQLDNLWTSLDSLNKLLTQETVDSLSRKLEALVELGVKPASDDALTPAFYNGVVDFNSFSLVLDTSFVRNIIYNEKTSENLKKNFSEVLQMGTQFKPFESIVIPIEKLTPAKPAKNLEAQLEAAKTEVDAIKPFHDCMKTVGKFSREKAVVDEWKTEKENIKAVGDGFLKFANKFNSINLVYTEFEKMQKRNPQGGVDERAYYDKLITDPGLSSVQTELGVIKKTIAQVIDVKITTWAIAPKSTQPENSLPSHDDIIASSKCLQSQDMIMNAKTAITGKNKLPAISGLRADNKNIVEVEKAVKSVAPFVAEVNKLKTAQPAKQKNSKSKLPFDQKLVNQLGKGIHVPVGLVDSLENEKYLEMIVAHYDTLNPTQKQDFDPYWNNVKGTVTGAPKYAKTLLTDFHYVSRDNLDEYRNEFKFQIDQVGLKTFNGAECMNKLHEIGAPLKDQEAEKRLRQLDLNFVNADSMVKAAAKAIGTVATYFLTVAPRSAVDSIQAVVDGKKENDESDFAFYGKVIGIPIGGIILFGGLAFFLYKCIQESRRKKKAKKDLEKMKVVVVSAPGSKQKKIAPMDADVSKKDCETIRDWMVDNADGSTTVERRPEVERTATKLTAKELVKMTKENRAELKNNAEIMTEQDKIIAFYQAPAKEQKTFNQTPRSVKSFENMKKLTMEDKYEECNDAVDIQRCNVDYIVGKGLDSYNKPPKGNTEASTRCNTTEVSDDVVKSLREKRSALQVDETQEASERRAKRVEELLDKTQDVSERARGGNEDVENQWEASESESEASESESEESSDENEDDSERALGGDDNVKKQSRAASKTNATPRKPKAKKVTEVQIHNCPPEQWLTMCLYFDETTAAPEDTAKGVDDKSEQWFPGAFKNEEIDICKIASGMSKKKFLEVESFPITEGENQCRYPLTATQVMKIFDEAKKLHIADDGFLELNRKKTRIVGDIHGQIRDFYYHYNLVFDDDDTTMLCLGDYVDRGDRSLCCLLSTAVMKCVNPKKFYFLSGNHEIGNSAINYGFAEECIRIFGEVWGRQVFCSAMKMCIEMPACALLQRRVFCAHGGIVKDMEVGIEKFKHLVKKHPVSEEEAVIVLTLRWADATQEFRYDISQPADFQKGWRAQDAVKNFTALGLHNICKACNIVLVIRAHEVVDAVRPFAGTRCFTLFSAANSVGVHSAASMVFHANNKVTMDVFRKPHDPPGVPRPPTVLRKKPVPPKNNGNNGQVVKK